MNRQPKQASTIIILAVSILLSACQGNTPTLTVTAQPSATEPAPRPNPEIVLPSSTPSPQPTPTVPNHLSVRGDQLRGVEITFMYPWQGDLEQRTRELVETFNRSNQWGIRVTARPQYSDSALEEAVAGALNTSESDPAGGKELPDVIAAPSSAISALQASYQVVADLNDYLDHPEWGFSEAQRNAYHSAFWQQDLSEDVRLGIPILRTAQVLYYNQTWANELGFTAAPTTPEEFERQVCEAAVSNNRSRMLDLFGTGGWLVDTDALTGLAWLGAFDADISPSSSDKEYTFESEQAAEAVDFLRGLLDKGCAWVGRSPNPRDELARRRALVISGPLNDIYLVRTVMENQRGKDQWTVIGFPGTDGETVVYSGGYSLAVIRPEREAEDYPSQMAGWLFIRWLSEPAQAARLAEAWPSFPVSQAVSGQLADYRQNFPWSLIGPLEDSIRPVPADPEWRLAGRILQDVFWSIFHLPPDQVENILPNADDLYQELRNMKTE